MLQPRMRFYFQICCAICICSILYDFTEITFNPYIAAGIKVFQTQRNFVVSDTKLKKKKEKSSVGVLEIMNLLTFS